MFTRELNLESILQKKSFFLLGPRQLGKSTLLQKTFKDALYIDLLDLEQFQLLANSAKWLEQRITAEKSQLVIIDEIQKMPDLLNEVHRLIEKNKKIKFILTGSSARKLRKQGVNLLGGRASQVSLHPLSWLETKSWPQKNIKFTDFLLYGGIPNVISSNTPNEELKDYVNLYLKEEILNEALTRNLTNFSRFLKTISFTNSQQVNFTSLGNEAQLSPSTVRDYYQVLNDTLIGEVLPCYTETTKRKALTTGKFYFFDLGVSHFLQGRENLKPKTEEFGYALEHLVYLELKSYIDYKRSPALLYFWRSTSQFEVDFVLQLSSKKFIAVEVKSTPTPRPQDYKGIKALAEEISFERKFVVCTATYKLTTKDKIEIINIETFLKELWSGQIF